jgi:hypothetical protein
MLEELKEWKHDWPLLAFGLVAAFADGIVIAQAWDWLTSTGRMSIWVLL